MSKQHGRAVAMGDKPRVTRLIRVDQEVYDLILEKYEEIRPGNNLMTMNDALKALLWRKRK